MKTTVNGYAEVLIDLANVCFRRGMYEACEVIDRWKPWPYSQRNNHASQRGMDGGVEDEEIRLHSKAMRNGHGQCMPIRQGKIAIENSDYHLVASISNKVGKRYTKL